MFCTGNGGNKRDPSVVLVSNNRDSSASGFPTRISNVELVKSSKVDVKTLQEAFLAKMSLESPSVGSGSSLDG
jgi:hypothetical protein